MAREDDPLPWHVVGRNQAVFLCQSLGARLGELLYIDAKRGQGKQNFCIDVLYNIVSVSARSETSKSKAKCYFFIFHSPV